MCTDDYYLCHLFGILWVAAGVVSCSRTFLLLLSINKVNNYDESDLYVIQLVCSLNHLASLL